MIILYDHTESYMIIIFQYFFTMNQQNPPQILHAAKSMPGIGCLPRSARGYFQGIPHAPEGGL